MIRRIAPFFQQKTFSSQDQFIMDYEDSGISGISCADNSSSSDEEHSNEQQPVKLTFPEGITHAKMLVIIMQSGEQKLITFTVPKESSCTVQDILRQVNVPFTRYTKIRCISNPGANIEYVVTVGNTPNTPELIR